MNGRSPINGRIMRGISEMRRFFWILAVIIILILPYGVALGKEVMTSGYSSQAEIPCDDHPTAGVKWEYYEYYIFDNSLEHEYFNYCYEYCAVCGRELWVGGNDYGSIPHQYVNGVCACGYSKNTGSEGTSHPNSTRIPYTPSRAADLVPVFSESEWKALCSETVLSQYTVLVIGSVNIRNGPGAKYNRAAHLSLDIDHPQAFTAYARVPSDEGGNEWYLIQYEKSTAYVSTAYSVESQRGRITYYIKVQQSTNIYAEPTTNSAILGNVIAAKDDTSPLSAIGRVYSDLSREREWYMVLYNGGYGFVPASCVAANLMK